QSRPLPQVVDPAFHVLRHTNLARPWAAESFAGPFSRSVNAHFGAVIREAAGVVQRVDWAKDELDIPLRIDVVQRFPCYLAIVLHVDIFVDHYDAFREHRLTGAPDGTHDLAGVPGIRFADGDENQVMEDPFGRHGDIADFGQLQAHQRQEDPLD